MPLIDFPRDPSEKQLRQFGCLTGILLPCLLGWWVGLGWPFWAGSAIGLVAAAVGWLQPRWLRPIFLGLTWLTLPLGLILGEVLLAIIFFLVVSPIAWLRRWLQPDPLARRWDRQRTSYWIPRPPTRPDQDYFRQF